MGVIRSVATALTYEPPKVKGSRFIAHVAPAASAEDAVAFLEARRAEYRDATHNCFAWRLGDADAFRAGDDGEPSGTAGRPILREIDGRRLLRVVVVVTRYFGGTKLGTGGLIRAYGGAAAAALDQAEIVESRIRRTLRLRFGYDLSGTVEGTLHSFDVASGTASYGEDVRMEVAAAEEDVDALRKALFESTAGRIVIGS